MDLKIGNIIGAVTKSELSSTGVLKKHPTEKVHRQSEKEETFDAKEIRRKIQEFLETINKNTSLRMRYDGDIDRVIVTIVETGTEKVIRQIPPEEFVAFLKRFRSSLALIFERSI
ncbi:MAG: flagellar protein FlaG [Deltaproteobacteria bacterium]|nr:flagellar protein FlaG [Deltaproteobacteria bacterium]